MTKFPNALDEENLLTHEVSDEVLETAGGKGVVAIFPLGPVRGCLNAPLGQFGLSSWRHPCHTAC